jgi:hypothetical protein
MPGHTTWPPLACLPGVLHLIGLALFFLGLKAFFFLGLKGHYMPGRRRIFVWHLTPS